MTPDFEVITAPQMLEPQVDLDKARELLSHMSEEDTRAVKNIMSILNQLRASKKKNSGTAVVSGISASALVVEVLRCLGYRKIQVITPPYSNGPITLVDW